MSCWKKKKVSHRRAGQKEWKRLKERKKGGFSSDLIKRRGNRTKGPRGECLFSLGRGTPSSVRASREKGKEKGGGEEGAAEKS